MERDTAAELQREFLEESHARLSDFARRGFASEGRGVVFMFEESILAALDGEAPGATMEFVADGSEALARRGGWPTREHADLVRDYDPARSMIVVVARRTGDRAIFTHHIRFSEEQPEQFVSIQSLVSRRDE